MLLLILAVAILISVFIVHTQFKEPVVAGAGWKPNYKVRDLEDLSEVLEFLSNQIEDDSENDSAAIERNSRLLSLLLAKDNDETKHTSAKITVDTKQSDYSSCSNHKYSGGVKSARQSLDRQMVVYITEDATFYETRGSCSYLRTVYEDETFKDKFTNLSWDMELANIDGEVFCKILSFTYSDNAGTMQIKGENSNKWISAPMDCIGLLTVDAFNREFLSYFAEMLDYISEYDKIDANKKTIKINEKQWNDLIDSVGEDEGTLGKGQTLDFEINRTSASAPRFTSTTTTDISDNHEIKDWQGNITEVVYTSQQSSVYQKMTISNIDNTIVSFDKDIVSIEVNSQEEFEELFWHTEKEDD